MLLSIFHYNEGVNTMKRKSLIIIILCISLPVYSIAFGYSILNIKTAPDFSNGVFPTALEYQFNAPIPDIIYGNNTEINLRIDSGLDFRKLKQDPVSGLPLAALSEAPDYPLSYMVLYDEMNFIFSQGFLHSYINSDDLLRLWFSFDLRFENAYERLNYLRDPTNLDSLFYIDGENRFNDWKGQPELNGNRSTSNCSISFGFDINFMQDLITRRNGVYNSFTVRLNPLWTDIFNDASHDYIFISNKLDLAYTIFHIDMNNSKRNTSWLSLVLDCNTEYRFITGNKVPYYIQGGNIFGATALNTQHIITNRTSLTLYGPQINSYDCFPYLAGFVDIGISLGKLLNTDYSNIENDFICSVGGRFEFVIFNVASFYYEIGYICNNIMDTPNTMISRFGFSLGV